MSSEFRVLVKTGDRKGAGTDANIYIVLYDDNMTKTTPILVDNMLRNDFERGNLDQFTIPRAQTESLGSVITRVEVWRDDSGLASAWYVDLITVENMTTRNRFEFPVLRWVDSKCDYTISHLDTSLPQLDALKEQRMKELEQKRKLYEYHQEEEGLPVRVKILPEDEQFSSDYKSDLGTMFIKTTITSNVVKFTSGDWEDLSDLTNVYTKDILHRPLSVDTWDSDVHFGRQRVASLNPSLIKLCTSLPQKFAVSNEMLKPLLEGHSLNEALKKKKLFICDLEIMRDLPKRPYSVCQPLALFFVNGKDQLVPVAIQLYQDPGPGNPVFLPSDPPMTWLLAKLWYNLMDGLYHQAILHLAERLMLSPEGNLNRVSNVGAIGYFELLKRGFKRWRLDIDGTLPEDLKQRGLDDPDVLPGYHFRDDALLLYNAINTYVSKYVKLYYDCIDTLQDDWELQSWGMDLTKPTECGGVGMLGIPGNGKFTCVDQLITVLTSFIYTCSVYHAAVNFPQYEEYAFPLNYPMVLRGDPPRDKAARRECDIMKAIPDKPTILEIMSFTKTLSERATQSLGDFEVQYIFDPKAKLIVEEFRLDLKKIGMEIKNKNNVRNPPYTYLDPELIPNSISI